MTGPWKYGFAALPLFRWSTFSHLAAHPHYNRRSATPFPTCLYSHLYLFGHLAQWHSLASVLGLGLKLRPGSFTSLVWLPLPPNLYYNPIATTATEKCCLRPHAVSSYLNSTSTKLHGSAALAILQGRVQGDQKDRDGGNRQLGRVEGESISYLRKAKALTGRNLARDGFDCGESSSNDQ